MLCDSTGTMRDMTLPRHRRRSGVTPDTCEEAIVPSDREVHDSRTHLGLCSRMLHPHVAPALCSLGRGPRAGTGSS